MAVRKPKGQPVEGDNSIGYRGDLNRCWHSWLRKWAESRLGQKPRQRITREDCDVQLQAWKTEGYAGASLNHLRQAAIMLWEKLDGPEHRCPTLHIPKFSTAPPRKGFFESAAVDKVLAALPAHYADVVRFAALSGWRRQEIQQLVWEEVDLEGGVIRLSPERSKNDEGRVLPIVGPIHEVIERRLALRDECPLPYVFWRAVGSRKARKTAVRYLPIGDWRKAWATACKAAGCEGRILHDFRRTVARNLRRAGVSTIDAMAWTGHKTDSMFKRYSIVAEDDLRATGEKFAAYLRQKESK